MAAPDSVAGERWSREFDDLIGRCGSRFGRVEPRKTFSRMLSGLVAELPAKNCWTLAEYAGDPGPGAMQHLLAAARVDDDGLVTDLRGYVAEWLGSDDVVLAVDETGDLKKGQSTVGTQRQYTGTAGRIENSQVAVYVSWSTPAGHAFVDRSLYLPKSWTTDRERCRAVGVPDEVEFATKPELARRMLISILDAGIAKDPWVTGDEVYGGDPKLAAAMEERGVGYVFAVARDHRVTFGVDRVRVDAVAAGLRKRSWQTLSAGDGAKGRRLYDWAWVQIAADPAARTTTGHRWLLIRRNNSSGELAFYRCFSGEPVPLARLVRVAGRRWSIEENFQTGKGLTGLDQHQVRTWLSWHRWTVFAMLAHAFLTVLAVTERGAGSAEPERVPLTRNEIRHLLAVLVPAPVRDLAFLLRWSAWRRLHQYRARVSHYRRRENYVV